jgi:hypothetical protein
VQVLPAAQALGGAGGGRCDGPGESYRSDRQPSCSSRSGVKRGRRPSRCDAQRP